MIFTVCDIRAWFFSALRVYLKPLLYLSLQVIRIPFTHAYHLKRQEWSRELTLRPFVRTPFTRNHSKRNIFISFAPFGVANVLLCKCKINLRLSRLNRDCHCGNSWPVCVCFCVWESVRLWVRRIRCFAIFVCWLIREIEKPKPSNWNFGAGKYIFRIVMFKRMKHRRWLCFCHCFAVCYKNRHRTDRFSVKYQNTNPTENLLVWFCIKCDTVGLKDVNVNNRKHGTFKPQPAWA